MVSKRTAAKKTTRAHSKSRVSNVLNTRSILIRFPKPLQNDGNGNEKGPILGIEVMLAKKLRGGKEIVYWTTDGKEGMTAYRSVASIIEERNISLDSDTLSRIWKARTSLLSRHTAPKGAKR